MNDKKSPKMSTSPRGNSARLSQDALADKTTNMIAKTGTKIWTNTMIIVDNTTEICHVMTAGTTIVTAKTNPVSNDRSGVETGNASHHAHHMDDGRGNFHASCFCSCSKVSCHQVKRIHGHNSCHDLPPCSEFSKDKGDNFHLEWQ